MKKNFLLAILAIVTNALYAQPVLTSGNSNIRDKDEWYRVVCPVALTAMPARGTSIIWDYSYLTATSTDTFYVLPAAGTPYVDSFPAATLACHTIRGSETLYGYFNEAGGRIHYLGEYAAPVGPGYVHAQIPKKFSGPFPLTYGTTWKDTSLYSYFTSTRYDRIYSIDSFRADAYGTLKTPAGVYTNALLLYNTSYKTDTSYSLGSGFPAVNTDTFETYRWRQPGFHFDLMTMTFKHGALVYIEYNIFPASVGVEMMAGSKSFIEVFPIPANDILHIRISDSELQSVTFSVINFTGYEILHYECTNLSGNEYTLPLSGVSNGTYLLQIKTQQGINTWRIVVN